MKKFILAFLSLLLMLGSLTAETKAARSKLQQARKELSGPRPNPARAEKLMQDSLKESPDFLMAQQDLADLYYSEKRFDLAAAEYKKAKALDESQKKLSRAERNALLDQLGLSQAQGRHLDDAIATYTAALSEDSTYALFEYNLACSYAEKGDLDTALPHLKKSWELRDSLPRGVEFPDPRKDDSFKKYWDDPRFQQAVANMVV